VRSVTGLRPNTIWLLMAGWIGLLLAGWTAGELAKNNLTAADLEIVRDIAAVRTAGLTTLAHMFSFLASGYWVTPVTAIVFLVLYRTGRHLDALGLGLSVIGASGLSAVDKLMVGRPRPPVEHLEAVTTSSFPSGHSTSAGALYVALLLVLLRGRPRRAVAITAGVGSAVMMAGVAISRIYLGVHYPSDVIGGLLLGSGWSLFVAVVIRQETGAGRSGTGDLDERETTGSPPIHPQFIHRREDQPMTVRRVPPLRGGRLRSLVAVAAVATVLVGALPTASALSTAGPAVAAIDPTIVSGAGPNGPRTIAPSDFVPHVHNPYFPLRPDTTFRYRGTKDGRPTIDVFHVTGRIRQILGVPCVGVSDRLYESGKLAERTTDWYAEDRQGRVWYFGEETAELSPTGKVTGTEGSWQTGVQGARPGIFMTRAPHAGQSFRQEFYRGEAEDHFRVIRLGAPASVPAGHFPRALETREWTPLEPGVIDRKLYVRGIGEVSEETLKGPLETSRLLSVNKP
jgi:membrane-associated phospholipid phosphatase